MDTLQEMPRAPQIVEISPAASAKIKDIMLEEYGVPDPQGYLRVFVQGGGCSGFQYGFLLEDIKNEDDFEITDNSVKVLVDSMSAQYLQGASIDYKDDLSGSQFVINNPNATTTCGCGSSFTV